MPVPHPPGIKSDIHQSFKSLRLLSSAAVICAALFSGTILHAQDPELLAKRQCRSVHINQQGHPSQASALYNVVKAKTSVPGTYFCAMNFDDG